MSKPWYRWRRGKKVSVNSGPATVVLVAASGTKQYRLLRFLLSNLGAAATIKFSDDTGDLTGVYNFANPENLQYEYTGGENGTAGDALNLVITGVGTTVTGDVWYEEI